MFVAREPDAIWFNARQQLLYVAIGAPGLIDVVDCRRMHGRTLAVARRQFDRMQVDLLGIVFNRATASVMRPQPHSLVAAGSSRP